MRSTAIALSLVLLNLGWVEAQGSTADGNGCLRLVGSTTCPGFQYAYLSPSNLSNAFPFFSEVTDVKTFDAGVLNYLANPDQWQNTKFVQELGCNNASHATIRYQRTVLCSQWVNEQWSAQCLAFYNGTSAATSQKMVCRQTCLDFSASEYQLVNNTEYCPGPDDTNGERNATLVKDYTDCTDWKSLATNNTATCVTGSDNGETNCGYGSSYAEFCNFCRGNSPSNCCYEGAAFESVCGFTLPVRPSASSSTSSAAPSKTSGSLQQGNDTSGSSSLSGGQIAGIVVGSVIGGLLLIAGLVFLALFCLRRRRSGGQTMAQRNSSEKGLLGLGHAPGAATSSPTMGGETLYATSGHAKSADSGLMGGFGAGAVAASSAGMMGAGLNNLPAERSGGVVLPRVKDENQNGDYWIETGAEVTVLWPYQATLPDELDLRPGMKIKVLRLYDDAWGTGQVVSGGSEEGEDYGRQGAFPIVCVSEGSSLGGTGSSRGSTGSH